MAVVAGQHMLRFTELDAQSDGLAAALRRLGVGPGVGVGLFLDRCPELVVGLMGVLKAGGYYLPLDPDYPPARLGFMLRDSGAAVVLTRKNLREAVPPFSGTILCVEEASQSGSGNFPGQNTRIDPENPAYLIYTSGSTGQPKGVLIPHRAIVNLMRWMQARFPLSPEDAVLQKSALSFDAAIWELHVALSSGARLVLAAPGTQGDAGALARQIIECGVTTALFVPSLLEPFINHPLSARCTCLRRLFAGGEALSVELARRVHKRLPAELINLYGPTEAAVASTWWVCERGDRSSRIPIGWPVANVRLHVMSEGLQPVAPGEEGELCIGGAGVGLGYLNRPELTAARFVPDPGADHPGARLYRSGDLCRFRPDGALEFLGRIDEQIKLHGFRIEPGEIEAALLRQPGIRSCLVMAREDPPGIKRLVAYVVPNNPGHPPEAGRLRAALGETLPPHMVPADFVALPEWPLSPSGKIDRHALPAPVRPAAAAYGSGARPRTHLEKKLAEIWAEVFGEAVDTQVSFFELGGNSILATRIAARIARDLGIEVPTRGLFEHPTIATMAEWLESGSAAIGRKAASDRSPPSESVPAEIVGDGEQPLSCCQRRMWFVEQLDGPSTQFHEPMAWLIEGPLKHDLLEQALNALIARHESLRTRFAERNGTAFRIVLPEYRYRLPVQDLRSLPSAARPAALAAVIAEDDRTPFDLQGEPPFRARLVQLDDTSHCFLWNCHHLLTDGWSQALFNRELASLYADLAAGRPLSLPAPAGTYSRHVRRQLEFLASPQAARELAYWENALRDPPPPISLPADDTGTVPAGSRSETVMLELPEALQVRLEAIGREERATLFMVLLAAFKAVLYRLSGQEDLIVGIPVAGRLHADDDSVFGAFIETLPIRTRIDAGSDFRNLLQRVRTAVLEAFDHQRVPFEQIIARIQPDRNARQPPLFRLLFNMYSMLEIGPLRLPEMTVTPIERAAPDAKYDCTLYVHRADGRLRFTSVHRADRFGRATVEEVLRQLLQVLEQAAANPGIELLEMSLVTPSAQAVLPRPAAALENRPYPPVTVQLQEAAYRHPKAVAVRQGDRLWNYAELNDASTAIAAELLRRGVKPAETVAVTGRRSFGLIAAIVGVMRARAVLFLLDPDLPVARRALLLERCRARLVIAVGMAEAMDRRNLPSSAAPDPIELTPDGRLAARSPAGDPAPHPPHPGPADPAYLFFTSGTTGVPKAVLGNHNGLSHFIAWERDLLRPTAEDRVAQLTGLSFDVILRDIFLPLTSGASLCLPDPAVPAQDPATLHWLGRHAVTILHTVPSLANAWLSAAPAEAKALTLRAVLFAGEPLYGGLVERWRAVAGPAACIFNLYGPTETTLAKACFAVPNPPVAGIQPVGKPLPDTQLLVLNPRGRLCGIREAGEIVIRTPYRTHGYVDASPEEQARFQPNPFTGAPDDILYWTGDRGSYATDGNLRISGRTDDQVKIRGMRVEPAEIAAILNRHPAVDQSVVTAQPDGAGGARLAAYFTTRTADADPSPEDLRGFLGSRLPDYMVPSVYIRVPQFPLTPNGKIDRRALPAVDFGRPAAKSSRVPPRTGTERLLAHLWREVLGLPEVGVHDNFFELGGHSLLAARLVGEIRRATDCNLPIAALFEAPCIADLAKLLEAPDASRGGKSLVTLQPEGSLRPLFCLHGWGGMVYIFLDLARALAPERPVYGLQAVGLDGSVPRHRSVEQMAGHYAQEIRSVQPDGPYNLIGYSAGGWIAYAVAQELQRQGQQARLHVLDTVMSCRLPLPLRILEATLHLLHRLPVHLRSLLRAPAGRKPEWLRGRLRQFRENLRRQRGKGGATPKGTGSVEPPEGRDYFAHIASLYRPKRYKGDLVLFAATGTPAYMRLFWRYLIAGRLEVHFIEGGHFEIIQRHKIEEFSRKLRMVLARGD